MVKASGIKQIIFSKVYLEKDDNTGKPFIKIDEMDLKDERINKEVSDLVKNVNRIHISISHEIDNAIAIVLIEKI